MISFKGGHYPKDVILYAVSFYVRYAVSYRDLEEIFEERGVEVDLRHTQSLGYQVFSLPGVRSPKAQTFGRHFVAPG
jgi:hypothetical protein